MRAKLLCVAVVVLAGVLLAASTAAASTVKVGNDGELWFTAAPGENNRVTLNRLQDGPIGVLVRDLGAPLAASYGCQPVEGWVLCAGIAARDAILNVRLRDGDDWATVDQDGVDLGVARLLGGAGDDRLDSNGSYIGGPALLDGGPGDDTLSMTEGRAVGVFGRSGDDTLSIYAGGDFDTGSGDDVVYLDDHSSGRLLLGPGRDILTTAVPPGLDRVSYDLGAGMDTIRYTDNGVYDLAECVTPCHIERVEAALDFPDSGLVPGVTFRGTDADETFVGNSFADTIEPRGGRDTVIAGGGADTVITAGDGARDKVSCGDGLDRFTGDPFDTTWGDCEVAPTLLRAH